MPAVLSNLQHSGGARIRGLLTAVAGDEPLRKAEATGGSGGSGAFTNSSTAPTSPNEGDRWFNPDDGVLYTRIADGTSSQWVEL